MEICQIEVHRNREYRRCQRTKIPTVNDLCLKCPERKEVEKQVDFIVVEYTSMKEYCSKGQLQDYLNKVLDRNQVRIKEMNQLHYQASEWQKRDSSEIMQYMGNHNSIRLEAIEIIKYCNNELQLLESVRENKKQPTILTTYHWQTNPVKELPELFELMVNKYKLIAPETTIEQFTAIFTNQPVDSITPLNWIVNKNLLAYFIDQLRTKQKISIHCDLWAIGRRCFIGCDNLSQLRDLYLNNKKNPLPKDSHLVDEMLNTLYPL